MYSELIPFTIFGIVLVLAVGSLAVWRRVIASHEDDTLHVLDATGAVPHQTSMAHKLDVIDRWGQILTIVTVIYLLIVLAMYGYQYWSHASVITPTR